MRVVVKVAYAFSLIWNSYVQNVAVREITCPYSGNVGLYSKASSYNSTEKSENRRIAALNCVNNINV